MGRIIGFRVDANEHIASGHLMRCIAIAKACIKEGNKCIFFLAEEKMTERLKENQIPYYILNSKWNDMETEYKDLTTLLNQQAVEVLVVDSFQASKKYLERLNTMLPVCYLDDMAKEIYDIAMILSYGSWDDGYELKTKYIQTTTKILAGMKFTPLREEFIRNGDSIEREKSILITTGGTDPYNISGKVVQELLKREYCLDYRLKVIVGSMNRNVAEMEDLLIDKRVELLKDVNNMGELMRKAQYAVSAGGTTLWELCASGTPTVCFSFVDNQVDLCKEMELRNLMLYAGDARKVTDIHVIIADMIEQFMKDERLAKTYADRMWQLVDGHGASRIADALLSL